MLECEYDEEEYDCDYDSDDDFEDLEDLDSLEYEPRNPEQNRLIADEV